MLAQETKSTLPQFIVQKPLYIFGEIFTHIIRVIIYARVSTEEQADKGTSLTRQVNKSLEYLETLAAFEQVQIQVVDILKEDYSGKTLDRPELNKLREIFRTGQADCLVVYKPNRLDRSKWGKNLLILLSEFDDLGIEVHYSKFNRRLDFDDGSSMLVDGNIEGWKSGEDHRETVEKLHQGRRDRIRETYHQNGNTYNHVVPNGHNAPYGHKLVKITVHGGKSKMVEKWAFEPNEDEAKWVRRIFQWFVFGDETKKSLNYVNIQEKLISLQAPRTGKWTREAVRRMLRNETYIGVWTYGKRGPKGLNHKSKHIKVAVPSIISKELWDLAQSRINALKKSSNHQKYQYLLSGRLKCGCCNRYRMGGCTQKNRPSSYYRCPGRNMTDYQDCNAPYYRADKLETKLWEWLTEIFTDPTGQKLKDGLLGYHAKMQDETSPIEQELELVKETINNTQEKWEQLVEDHRHVKGRLHKARLESDIEILEQQIFALREDEIRLKSELEQLTLTDEQILTLDKFASDMRNDWTTISQDFDSRKFVIDYLNIQITLDITEDGRKRAKVKGKITPTEKTILIDGCNTCITPANLYTVQISTILYF